MQVAIEVAVRHIGSAMQAGTDQAGTDQAGTDQAAAAPGTAAEVSLGAAAQASAENFPVAIRILPARYRRHLMALYGFARLTDDIGDEVTPEDGCGCSTSSRPTWRASSTAPGRGWPRCASWPSR